MIVGNRGDLLSRFGILEALERLWGAEWTVFAHRPEDVGPLQARVLPYGPLHHFWPRWSGLKAIRESDAVVWTGGLDLQDDSSLLKLLHTWVTFLSYRSCGKPICVLHQGAGPIRSRAGRFLTRRVVNACTEFLTRDSGTLSLLERIGVRSKLRPGHDGIFLGGLDRLVAAPGEADLVSRLTAREKARPLIGFNIRLWFHFSSSILPYQFHKKSFQARSRGPMEALIRAAIETIGQLRKEHDAAVVLLSMYEPGTHPWEDDLPHLRRIKEAFPADAGVRLLEDPLSIGGFCDVMRRLDLMIGTRLHSTLTALRFGVPAINLAYTDKCTDIFGDLGMTKNAIPLGAFMSRPALVLERCAEILADPSLAFRIRTQVGQRIQENEAALLEMRNRFPAEAKQRLAA
jgi:polysaccharide pyruvyl transferase WcaK-like protein